METPLPDKVYHSLDPINYLRFNLDFAMLCEVFQTYPITKQRIILMHDVYRDCFNSLGIAENACRKLTLAIEEKDVYIRELENRLKAIEYWKEDTETPPMGTL